MTYSDDSKTYEAEDLLRQYRLFPVESFIHSDAEEGRRRLIRLRIYRLV